MMDGDRTRRAGWALLIFVAVLAVGGIGLRTLYSSRGGRPVHRPLNAERLRVTGGGRADASRVVSAALFPDPRVQRAYRIAAAIPETLNKLYCWCGCIEGGMRSNLECFESEHAANCEVCLAGADVGWELRQKGVTDPAKVQQALDARYAPQRRS